MELKDIIELIDKFDNSGVVALDLELGEVKLSLKKADGIKQPKGGFVQPAAIAPAPVMPQLAPAPAAEASEVKADKPQQDNAEYIKSPLVGTFYAASAPDAKPFVTVGQKINKGGVVCLVEAMKMMNDVTAPFDCVIEEVVAQNGEPIGFDEPMFRVSRI
ncbi:MAG: acetyl-CoA carboxylase biotin carboxyl carrier protein [Acutalibacteraceae bacterium]|nr:acetyl-CoA carboxylase biotin carboxyl carrier protein [Bacillota bacterium]